MKNENNQESWASPPQVHELAEDYRKAATLLLRLGRPGKPLTRAPFRLSAIHAIELYLTALLLHRGHSPNQIRKMQHDLSARVSPHPASAPQPLPGKARPTIPQQSQTYADDRVLDERQCRARTPEIEFIRPCNLCPRMKRITLANIRMALEENQRVVTIAPEIAQRARLAIERMLAI